MNFVTFLLMAIALFAVAPCGWAFTEFIKCYNGADENSEIVKCDDKEGCATKDGKANGCWESGQSFPDGCVDGNKGKKGTACCTALCNPKPDPALRMKCLGTTDPCLVSKGCETKDGKPSGCCFFAEANTPCVAGPGSFGSVCCCTENCTVEGGPISPGIPGTIPAAPTSGSVSQVHSILLSVLALILIPIFSSQS